ncbi:hypothetical protein GCM10022419_136310 [Nonomuraea rosea]|uniref:Uncharacterized protein n=1 Tax=Nonomuraea rosea TaxID=638574 RepID=A0ABP7AAA9_9ACTN
MRVIPARNFAPVLILSVFPFPYACVECGVMGTVELIPVGLARISASKIDEFGKLPEAGGPF